MTATAIYPILSSVDQAQVLPVDQSARIPGRLASLDTFRGLVILLMLFVNNIGDPQAVGYFWKHADWSPRPLGSDLSHWLRAGSHIAAFPLFTNCTLADYVMPMFMLIIGIAIPFSASAARRKGNVGASYWLGIIRRGLTLYAFGWCIGLSLQFLNWRFSSHGDSQLTFVLGMDVLQLLGTSYIVARIIYCLPSTIQLATAALLFIWHWSLLRFFPQGDVAAGTFTENHNAIGYIYSSLPIFRSVQLLSGLKFNIIGMLSVPPAVAMMTLGTWIGETLSNVDLSQPSRIRRLLFAGCFLIVVGLAWSFDLPMNKPRWTPCYLIYCAGVGSLWTGFLYWLIDVRLYRTLLWPLTVLGANAIGIYFLSIMAKIWFLNIPRVNSANGRAEFFSRYLVETLQRYTTPALGSWLFTVLFVAVVWSAAALAYHHRLFWKV